MASNFFCWVCSHNRSNNLDRVLFLNWLWKFALMCLTHHLLLKSGHNGALYRSVLPSFMSLIACKIPLCLLCITRTFYTSWTTMFFNLSRNQYQLSPFSPLCKCNGQRKQLIVTISCHSCQDCSFKFSYEKSAIYANDRSTHFESHNAGT
jgi:hypothetical protein